jgi:hypothetical protein
VQKRESGQEESSTSLRKFEAWKGRSVIRNPEERNLIRGSTILGTCVVRPLIYVKEIAGSTGVVTWQVISGHRVSGVEDQATSPARR